LLVRRYSFLAIFSDGIHTCTAYFLAYLLITLTQCLESRHSWRNLERHFLTNWMVSFHS